MLQVQEVLRRDPRSGQLLAFVDVGAIFLRMIWHDGQ
jgi:hypothetical protein